MLDMRETGVPTLRKRFIEEAAARKSNAWAKRQTPPCDGGEKWEATGAGDRNVSRVLFCGDWIMDVSFRNACGLANANPRHNMPTAGIQRDAIPSERHL